MSSRAGQPDTLADISLRTCVLSTPPSSFVMIAGAGSGKTTSLIKGLRAILQGRNQQLIQKRQRIACITYTQVAADEIRADVGDDRSVHVSTIHSFLWSIIRTFDSDIREWVTQRIDQKLQRLRHEADTFSNRVGARTREKNTRDIDRYVRLQKEIGSVRRFSYGVGSDYANGVLGHDDILKMVPELIGEKVLLRELVARQYPIVFVDERQDTFPEVVTALKEIQRQHCEHFCVGFFGDPMQQIYPTGIGSIPLETGWQTISKPENFRSTSPILKVANAIRQPIGDLQQYSGRQNDPSDGERIIGSAHIFVLPADDSRESRIEQVQSWMAEQTADEMWLAASKANDLQVLVIVHRMAAKRLGFGALYAALNDRAPESFKGGLIDGSAWPVRPFLKFVMPIIGAVRAADDFKVMQLLREHSPLLDPRRVLNEDVSALLSQLRIAVQHLESMTQPSSVSSVREVLAHLYDGELIARDPRIVAHLELVQSSDVQVSEPDSDSDDDENEKQVHAMEAFLNCSVTELWPYRAYINDESPFSTHHGVKGAEFDRVIVVLDDEEGKFNQFSYDRFFGTRPLTPNDRNRITEGGESVVDRTRRLFYVCSTRAKKDLAIIYFAPDPEAAVGVLKASGLFGENSVHDLSALGVS